MKRQIQVGLGLWFVACLVSATGFVITLGKIRVSATINVIAAFGFLSYPLLAFAGLLVLLAGIGALLLARGYRLLGAEAALVAAVVLASGRYVVPLGWRYRYRWLHEIATEAKPIIRKIEDAQKAHRAAPEVSTIPDSDLVLPALGAGAMEYRKTGADTWELSITTPWQFGMTDFFVYRSDQAYPEVNRSPEGRVLSEYERIEDWAYIHDLHG